MTTPDDYHSYDYLDAGEDYRSFELAEMHAGFEPYEVPLTAEQAERLEAVLAEDTVVSLHEHPFQFPADIEGDTWDYIREGRVHTPYDFLAESPLDAVFDFHLDGLSGIHSKHGWKWDDIVHDVAMRAADQAHSDYAVRAGSVADIDRARDEGKLAFVPALESSAMVENELDRIDLLYGMGIRLMGVTYNASNSIGTGKRDIYERDGGLTSFGVDAVHRMNDVGIAVSTSHASEQTTLDVCEVSEKPVFDTHALAAGVGDRGTSDDCFEAIADTGGVVGVVASSVLPDIETYMEHFEYMVDLVGVDHVAFGPDVLYGDHRALLGLLAEQHDIDPPGEIDGRLHVKGLENPTEAWQNIPRWLVKEGYTDEEIEKVLGGNILRALDDAW
ncbi:dipeptidase [Halobacterium wangiae]|uniref:dipeptidase n=1 Tax=Halobacterium wangiae TaxID=2902623 RepID=UPI001E3CC1C1|nr:membrane dipeptidase [Halobacterium wangiae]